MRGHRDENAVPFYRQDININLKLTIILDHNERLLDGLLSYTSYTFFFREEELLHCNHLENK